MPLRRMWRATIRVWLKPSDAAALTKSTSRMGTSWLRTTLTIQATSAMATTKARSNPPRGADESLRPQAGWEGDRRVSEPHEDVVDPDAETAGARVERDPNDGGETTALLSPHAPRSDGRYRVRFRPCRFSWSRPRQTPSHGQSPGGQEHREPLRSGRRGPGHRTSR